MLIDCLILGLLASGYVYCLNVTLYRKHGAGSLACYSWAFLYFLMAFFTLLISDAYRRDRIQQEMGVRLPYSISSIPLLPSLLLASLIPITLRRKKISDALSVLEYTAPKANAASIDQKYYDQIAQEFMSNNQIPGLWTRALAESDGDELRARSIYIKLRTTDIIQKEKTFEEFKKEEEIRKKSEADRLMIIAQIQAKNRAKEEAYQLEQEGLLLQSAIVRVSSKLSSTLGWKIHIVDVEKRINREYELPELLREVELLSDSAIYFDKEVREFRPASEFVIKANKAAEVNR